ncbi:MAG: methyltransferase [Boseongicola sp.]|nr:MAG: methyltransferase [Boseongicola sp.]
MPQGNKKHDRLLKPFMSRNQRQRMVPIQTAWLERDYFKIAHQKYSSLAGIPDQRLFFLQSLLRGLNGISGDVVECGVRFGKSTLFMAEADGGRRNFHVFDSFEGLSDAVPDKDIGVGVMKRDGVTRKFAISDMDAVMGRFDAYDNIVVYEGWIPDRFSEIAECQVALLHVDVDLYQPTLDTLEFFWGNVSPGGIAICDDYGAQDYPGAQAAFDEFFADRPEFPVELPSGQAFVVKRS